MKRAWLSLTAILLNIVFAQSAFAQASEGWAALEEQDLRLATVAERIMLANAPLCNRQMPITGLILHSEDQYREGTADIRFRNGSIAIAALRPGSPAAMAGLRRDDAIIAINGIPTADLTPQDSGNMREAAFDLLADQDPGESLTFRINRSGDEIELTVEAQSGCRSLVEIRTGNGPRARSDGRVIQITYDFAAAVNDDELAVVFAHELAHSILEHRRRKEDAGIDVGLMGEIGSNQQANRQAEVEADRLSIHLLANAGYPPELAPHFWRTGAGRGLGGGILASRVYPSSESRAEILDNEIRYYLPNGRGPTWPGHLLIMRERSFATE